MTHQVPQRHIQLAASQGLDVGPGFRRCHRAVEGGGCFATCKVPVTESEEERGAVVMGCGQTWRVHGGGGATSAVRRGAHAANVGWSCEWGVAGWCLVMGSAHNYPGVPGIPVGASFASAGRWVSLALPEGGNVTCRHHNTP